MGSSDDEQLYGGRRDSAAPLGAAARGRLQFVRGASLVSIEASGSMPDLYRAHFEGAAPRIAVRDGTVSVQYLRLSLAEWARYALLWGRHAAEITLNAAIPWQLEVRGGVSKCRADLPEMMRALCGRHSTGSIFLFSTVGVSNANDRDI